MHESIDHSQTGNQDVTTLHAGTRDIARPSGAKPSTNMYLKFARDTRGPIRGTSEEDQERGRP
eukprot:249180-Heterocapsa_arctica.AAC.1